MLGVYLWSVLGLSRAPGSVTDDPSIFICDAALDGNICSGRGMSVYVTYDNPPTRPSTFYTVSSTEWIFSEANNSDYLGVSSSEAPSVSGKFSGVFISQTDGYYGFYLNVKHDVADGVCHFDIGTCKAYIELDLSYTSTGSTYDDRCFTLPNPQCSDYLMKTNSFYIYQSYGLGKAGLRYPLFAGLTYDKTIPQAHNLSLELTYTNPYGDTQMITREAFAGMEGYTEYMCSTLSSSGSVCSSLLSSSSPSSSSSSSNSSASVDSEDGGSSLTVSGSKKTSATVVGCVSAGVIVVVIDAIAFWVFIRRMNKDREHSDSDPIDHRKDSEGSGLRRSDRDVEVGGGTLRRFDGSDRLGTRAGDDRLGRMGSGLSDHVGGSHSSHMSNSRTSRVGSSLSNPVEGGHSSHKRSVSKRRSGSGHSGHRRSVSKRRSGSGH